MNWLIQTITQAFEHPLETIWHLALLYGAFIVALILIKLSLAIIKGVADGMCDWFLKVIRYEERAIKTQEPIEVAPGIPYIAGISVDEFKSFPRYEREALEWHIKTFGKM